MKTIALAAAVVVFGGLGAVFLMQSGPAVDPLVSGSIAAPLADFTATNLAGNMTCQVMRGQPVSHRSRQLSASVDCNKVWPGLAEVKTWTDNEDGTVILANASGEAVLTVVEGEGPGYETLEPAGATITLNAIR